MVPVRFSSGVGVTWEQYHAFWGWRYWAERTGLPSGEVRWKGYEEFCVRWFGDVPIMMPLSEPLGEREGDGEQAGARQGAGGQGA
jgi:hypothetical protein